MKDKRSRGLHRILILVLVAVCVVAGYGTGFAQDNKVGYLDVRKIINGSKAGKLAKQDLEAFKSEKERLIGRSMEAIGILEKAINRNLDMDEVERRQMVEELRAKYQRHERLVEDARREIQEEDMQLFAMIMHHADAALHAVAKRRGYTLVIRDPEVVGYVDSSVDITEEVLAELDKAGN